MRISASEVNKLRQATGAGMMDCKKALVEVEGDFDKAIENLRKKGQKVAANRADRASSEGAVLAKVNTEQNAGVLGSLNCETDFVARNESYLELATSLTELALGHNTLDSLLAASIDGMTVAEKLIEQTGVIGEKFPTQQIKNNTPQLVEKLRDKQNKFIWFKAAASIMTTDTRPKLAYEECRIWNKDIRLSAIAKGSGTVSYTHLTLPTNREV